jgi:hypothetical protein
MDVSSIAEQGVALLLGAIGGGILGALATWLGNRSALKTAKEQLSAAKEQQATLKNQNEILQSQLTLANQTYAANNLPNIAIEIYSQVNPPENKGFWLKATNHHATIAIDNLVVTASLRSPSGDDIGFLFPILRSLEAGKTIKTISNHDMDTLLKTYFVDFDPSGAMIHETPSESDSFASFPMQVLYSYLPCFTGASNVENTKTLYFRVRKLTKPNDSNPNRTETSS